MYKKKISYNRVKLTLSSSSLNWHIDLLWFFDQWWVLLDMFFRQMISEQTIMDVDGYFANTMKEISELYVDWLLFDCLSWFICAEHFVLMILDGEMSPRKAEYWVLTTPLPFKPRACLKTTFVPSPSEELWKEHMILALSVLPGLHPDLSYLPLKHMKKWTLAYILIQIYGWNITDI